MTDIGELLFGEKPETDRNEKLFNLDPDPDDDGVPLLEDCVPFDPSRHRIGGGFVGGLKSAAKKAKGVGGAVVGETAEQLGLAPKKQFEERLEPTPPEPTPKPKPKKEPKPEPEPELEPDKEKKEKKKKKEPEPEPEKEPVSKKEGLETLKEAGGKTLEPEVDVDKEKEKKKEPEPVPKPEPGLEPEPKPEPEPEPEKEKKKEPEPVPEPEPDVSSFSEEVQEQMEKEPVSKKEGLEALEEAGGKTLEPEVDVDKDQITLEHKATPSYAEEEAEEKITTIQEETGIEPELEKEKKKEPEPKLEPEPEPKLEKEEEDIASVTEIREQRKELRTTLEKKEVSPEKKYRKTLEEKSVSKEEGKYKTKYRGKTFYFPSEESIPESGKYKTYKIGGEEYTVPAGVVSGVAGNLQSMVRKRKEVLKGPLFEETKEGKYKLSKSRLEMTPEQKEKVRKAGVEVGKGPLVSGASWIVQHTPIDEALERTGKKIGKGVEEIKEHTPIDEAGREIYEDLQYAGRKTKNVLEKSGEGWEEIFKAAGLPEEKVEKARWGPIPSAQQMWTSAGRFKTQYEELPGATEDVIATVARAGSGVVSAPESLASFAGVGPEDKLTASEVMKSDAPTYEKAGWLGGRLTGEYLQFYGGSKMVGGALGFTGTAASDIPIVGKAGAGAVGKVTSFAAKHPTATKAVIATPIAGIEGMRTVQERARGEPWSVVGAKRGITGARLGGIHKGLPKGIRAGKKSYRKFKGTLKGMGERGTMTKTTQKTYGGYGTEDDLVKAAEKGDLRAKEILKNMMRQGNISVEVTDVVKPTSGQISKPRAMALERFQQTAQTGPTVLSPVGLLEKQEEKPKLKELSQEEKQTLELEEKQVEDIGDLMTKTKTRQMEDISDLMREDLEVEQKIRLEEQKADLELEEDLELKQKQREDLKEQEADLDQRLEEKQKEAQLEREQELDQRLKEKLKVEQQEAEQEQRLKEKLGLGLKEQEVELDQRLKQKPKLKEKQKTLMQEVLTKQKLDLKEKQAPLQKLKMEQALLTKEVERQKFEPQKTVEELGFLKELKSPTAEPETPTPTGGEVFKFYEKEYEVGDISKYFFSVREKEEEEEEEKKAMFTDVFSGGDGKNGEIDFFE